MIKHKTSPWSDKEIFHSPDGKFSIFYYARSEIGMGGPSVGETWLFDKNGKCKLLAQGTASAIIFSDDSRYLAYAKWRERTSQDIVIIRVEDMAIRQTEGENMMIFESFEGGILRLFYDHEKNRRILGDLYKPKDEIVVNADLLFANEPVGKRVELKIPSPFSDHIKITSPDGNFIAEYTKKHEYIQNLSGEVWLSGENLEPRKLESKAKGALIFSSDSRYLAYVKQVANAQDIVIVRLSDMKSVQESGVYASETMFESFEAGILRVDYAFGYEYEDRICLNAAELFARLDKRGTMKCVKEFKIKGYASENSPVVKVFDEEFIYLAFEKFPMNDEKFFSSQEEENLKFRLSNLLGVRVDEEDGGRLFVIYSNSLELAQKLVRFLEIRKRRWVDASLTSVKYGGELFCFEEAKDIFATINWAYKNSFYKILFGDYALCFKGEDGENFIAEISPKDSDNAVASRQICKDEALGLIEYYFSNDDVGEFWGLDSKNLSEKTDIMVFGLVFVVAIILAICYI